ncbi:MAG: hypothetical protein MZV63_33870 [Marinilabiliales bacterium]|nr:hypothetical protein [Marinilabiliales bacterium]
MRGLPGAKQPTEDAPVDARVPRGCARLSGRTGRPLAMPIEYTLPRFDVTARRAFGCHLPFWRSSPNAGGISPRWSWPACLVAYLVGMVQDFQRIRDLRAEPSPLSKTIITKHEAWQRVNALSARTGVLARIQRVARTLPEQPRSA